MDGLTVLIFAREPGPRLDSCLRSVEGLTEAVLTLFSTPGFPEYVEWEESFDSLYNAGLERVETGWVLHLNEDERLSDGSKKRIEKAIRSGASNAYRLVREERAEDGVTLRSEIVRLWRADQAICYIGCVSPILSVGDSSLLDVRVIHVPVLGTDERLEQRTRLIEKELTLRPGQIRYEALRAQNVAISDPEKAPPLLKDVVQRLIDDSSLKLPPALASWLMVGEIQSMSDEVVQSPLAAAAVRTAWRLCSSSPNAVWAIANLEVRRDDLFNAMHAWMELDDMLSTGSYDRSCPPDAVVKSAVLYKNLAKAALIHERNDVFMRSLKSALALDPADPALRQMAART